MMSSSQSPFMTPVILVELAAAMWGPIIIQGFRTCTQGWDLKAAQGLFKTPPPKEKERKKKNMVNFNTVPLASVIGEIFWA